MTPPPPLTSYQVSKNNQMDFPYHTESVSQHVDHFKPKNFLKKLSEKKYFFFREGEVGTLFLHHCTFAYLKTYILSTFHTYILAYQHTFTLSHLYIFQLAYLHTCILSSLCTCIFTELYFHEFAFAYLYIYILAYLHDCILAFCILAYLQTCIALLHTCIIACSAKQGVIWRNCSAKQQSPY